MDGPANSSPTRARAGMERGILGLFIAAAGIMGVALTLPALRYILATAAGDASVELLTDAAVPHRAGDAGGVQIVAAAFDSALVTARGVSSGAQALLLTGAIAAALTTLLVTAAVTFFLLLLLWRRPFHRALLLTTRIAGSALLLGSLLSGGLSGLGRMMAADELNPLAHGVFTVGFSFDLLPLAAGLGVLALSVVFRYGSRLQRDTEGLV